MDAASIAEQLASIAADTGRAMTYTAPDGVEVRLSLVVEDLPADDVNYGSLPLGDSALVRLTGSAQALGQYRPASGEKFIDDRGQHFPIRSARILRAAPGLVEFICGHVW